MPRSQSKNVSGLTDPEYDGKGTPDLRYWLRYWCSERRSAAEAHVKGIDRRRMIARLQAEINARYDAGRARKPAGPC